MNVTCELTQMPPFTHPIAVVNRGLVVTVKPLFLAALNFGGLNFGVFAV